MSVVLHGVVRDLSGASVRQAFVVTEGSERAPTALLVRYFVDYLDAGTEAECASHPMLRTTEHTAAALLNLRYLRPRRERLLVERAEFVESPSSGELLHRDAYCVIHRLAVGADG